MFKLGGRGPIARSAAAFTVLALTAILFPVLATTPAGAAAPAQVGFTLEGCRNNGGVVLPNADGDFICLDAAYTPGNLGKGWNELDLVPYRLAADAGGSAPATQTYTLSIVLDREDASRPGYDVLSVPVLNDRLSDASCTEASVVPAASAPASTLTPGLGGADKSIYRLVTITQLRNSTCVYDYYGRLALGSHLYPGSSLHANLANESQGTAGIGSKEVSIPVKEILPQELSKTMSATQGEGSSWNVTKQVTPTTLLLGDTCTDISTDLAKSVSITVSWTKLPPAPNGAITVVTNISATNPAAREILVDVTDRIYSGLTLMDTVSTAVPVAVSARSTEVVLTHTTTVPAGTLLLNDIATATYTDEVTGIVVPGNTTATASAIVQSSGVSENATAVIRDVETISGDHFSYSVDAVSDATGTFDDGYVLGTHTTGSVGWTSASKSASGSVTFTKTVYVDEASVASGILSDTASLLGSSGFTASDTESVTLSSAATVDLTIDKTIPNVLQGDETQTFNFKVWAQGANTTTGTPAGTASISFTAGQTERSATVSGLAPGIYFVTEDPAAGWDAQLPSGFVDLSVQEDGSLTCGGSVSFANDFERATATAVKVTDPIGHESGWEMCLEGPGIEGEECILTGNNGEATFTMALQEGGVYTITETEQAGWQQTGASGCSFSVNYPADSDRLFTCTISNEQLGRIIVKKLTDPPNETQLFPFTLVGGPSALDQSFDLTHNQTHDSDYVEAGNGYAADETAPEGWDQSSASCSDGSPVANIDVSPGETVTCTFVNTERGLIIINKVTVPSPATQAFDFELNGGTSELSQSFSLTGGGSHESGFVEPGSGYAASETVPADWNQTSATCSDGSPVDDIDVSPGEVVNCTFTNTAKPNGITLDKKVNGADHATIGDALLAHVLDPLTYAVVITNNGQVPLTITALSDSLYAAFAAACPQAVGSVLAVGASFTCTYQVSAGSDAHNVASVSAVDSINRPVSDSDDTFVDVIHPGILIVKTADPISVDVSGPVTYTYVVTNTGDTALHDVVVTDDILGTIGTVDSLAPGESKTLTMTVVVDTKTPTTNVGTATGKDILGKTVTDDDDATITVVAGLVVAEVAPLVILAELPRTGSPIGAQAGLGIILLQAGLALEFLARRRRKLHPQAG